MFNLDSLLRPNIKELVPYSSARSEFTAENCTLLDANECCYELEGFSGFNRYPDPLQVALKSAVSELKQIGPEKIFLGSGSDEPIDLLLRAFCEPGRDTVIVPTPSYGMYKVSAKINNVEVIEVLLKGDFSLNIEGTLAQVLPTTKLIFLCSPNNPTGNSIANADVERIANSFSGLVVLDEAYVDFAQESGVSLLAKLPNLVVLQTFSKAWALAGIRLGICFASSEIVEILNKIKFPYNINSATIELALTALKQREVKEQFVSRIFSERARMATELGKLSSVLEVYPSDANFLLVKFRDAEKTYKQLLSNNIVVRRRDKEPLCEGCLRITIGTKLENDSLLMALASFEGEN